MKITINQIERSFLLDVVRPSNNSSIFHKVIELNKDGNGDKKLSKAMDKANHISILNILEDRESKKSDLIKNEIAYYILLENIAQLDINKDHLFVLDLEDVLLIKLIEAISLRILKLQNTKENTDEEAMRAIDFLKSILNKIEESIDVMEYFEIKKNIKSDTHPSQFKEICIKLVGVTA